MSTYSLDNLTYKYRGGTKAVDSATATIGPGVHLLLGENGAGKTTLLHLMCGLLFPTSGTCRLDGYDLSARLPEIQRRYFFLPDDFECPFPTITEMARRHGLMYPDFSFDLLYANLKDFGLTGREKLKNLSLGQRRKSFLSYALSLRTEVLLLDEPANGMDISSKKLLRQLIQRCLSDDSTLIVSTHNVYDLDNIFDGLIVMHKGQLRLSLPLWQLTERVSFVTSPTPIYGAIYQEPDKGLFHAIVANESGAETDIDFALMFSAIMAPVGDSFIKFVNREEQ